MKRLNENPYKLANEKSFIQWILKTSLGEVIAITMFSLALIGIVLYKDPSLWEVYALLIPFWYVLNVIRWYHLYKKNVILYHNWEETYGNIKNKNHE
jgi:hypothetical protein